MNRFLKNPLVVRSLVGSKYIENAVKSFHSLRLASKQPVKIIFHDDGSCTENDVERLLSQIPNSELLRRKQVNEEVEDYLKAYPACRKYRNDSVWGLKLLDVPLLSNSLVQYSDGDFLYFQKFDRLFPENQNPIFLEEKGVSYATHLSTLVLRKKIGLIKNFAAGILRFPKSIYDIDFIEWFLSKNFTPFILGLAEQTCYSSLLCDKDALKISNRSFHIQLGKKDFPKHKIALHLSSAEKPYFDKFYQIALESLKMNNVSDFIYEEAENVTPITIVEREVIKKYLALKNWH